ncbi:myeloid cell surface antigen CD33-like [Lithobates pipiens]
MLLMKCGFLHQTFITTIVLLSTFCKDSNSQFGLKIPGFTINVTTRVTVQRNLCVHIPCTFQIPSIYTLPSNAQGAWLKFNNLQHNVVARKDGLDDPQDKYPRFFLTGEVWKGDCSLRISDAKAEDDSLYTFRLEDRGVPYSFAEVSPKVTVTDLTDTPEISTTGTLVAGERVTLTCTSPGRCAGEAPKITWEGATVRKAMVHRYTIYYGDGTRTYHSNLTFSPSIKDNMEKLLCIVTFTDNLSSKSEIVELEVEDAPPKSTTVCSSMDSKLIAGIIIGNIIILLLAGLGLLFFIKRHMKNAGNRPHESKPQGNESAYQDLHGQSIHTYEKITMK